MVATNFQLEEEIAARVLGQVVLGQYSASTVGETFTVRHTLGQKPTMVASLPFTDARVWAEEADERLWTYDRVVLRCNVADAPLRLLIVR